MPPFKPQMAIGRRVLREEGPLAVLRRGSRFLMRYVFFFSRVHVFDQALGTFREERFRPRIANLVVRIVHSNREADELPADGDLRRYFLSGRRRLDAGATAVCLFIGGEFAHGGWVVETAEAKKTVDRRPYRVDFARGEACTGGSWTRPKFRGLGLMTYGYYLRLEYLRQRGFVRARNSVTLGNRATLRVYEKFSSTPCARGWYLRLGPWEFWRERPWTPATGS